jgi:hypothetical protein
VTPFYFNISVFRILKPESVSRFTIPFQNHFWKNLRSKEKYSQNPYVAFHDVRGKHLYESCKKLFKYNELTIREKIVIIFRISIATLNFKEVAKRDTLEIESNLYKAAEFNYPYITCRDVGVTNRAFSTSHGFTRTHSIPISFAVFSNSDALCPTLIAQ